MSVNWYHMAVAVSARLEYERLCMRKVFIDEASVVRHCVEFIQASTPLVLTPEYNHIDLPGNKRIDAIGRSKSDSLLTFALEAKWIKSDGGTRNWSSEIAEDILRLEKISQETNAKTERVIAVAGINMTLNSKFIEGNINIGNGRVPILSHILQPRSKASDYPYKQTRIPVRECDDRLKKFFKARSKEVSNQLPVSYQVSLAGHHVAGPSKESVEMYVWIIRRSRKRSFFVPS